MSGVLWVVRRRRTVLAGFLAVVLFVFGIGTVGFAAVLQYRRHEAQEYHQRVQRSLEVQSGSTLINIKVGLLNRMTRRGVILMLSLRNSCTSAAVLIHVQVSHLPQRSGLTSRRHWNSILKRPRVRIYLLSGRLRIVWAILLMFLPLMIILREPLNPDLRPA